MRRLLLIAPTLALVTALLVAGPALSALRIGTNGPDGLTGTAEDDQITGKGDGDRLKGLAGNDTYFFADGFAARTDGKVAADTVVETANGGIDTVNFRGVRRSKMTIRLIPDWGSINPIYNRAEDATVARGQVRFFYTTSSGVVQSIIENAIGGQGDGDTIQGGRGKNVLQPGGGATDTLRDNGGWKDGAQGLPGIPASNDVYKGFGSNTGTDLIEDWGGTNDSLDMRPFSTDEVYIDSIDLDGLRGTEESLMILTGASDLEGVIVVGHFGPYSDLSSTYGQLGQIETIMFANATITDTEALGSLSAASIEAHSRKQARLAEAAERFVKNARNLIDPNDPLGFRGTGERRK
jgi:hypothetical protein